MSSIRELKKNVNRLADEITYDIELYVGMNLDKNHFESQKLYEEVYDLRREFLERINRASECDKGEYKTIQNDFVKRLDQLNQRLCEIISKE